MNKKRIIISMEGGLIQDVRGIPRGVEIEVRDFDIEGTSEVDPLPIDRRKDLYWFGDQYVRSVYP